MYVKLSRGEIDAAQGLYLQPIKKLWVDKELYDHGNEIFKVVGHLACQWDLKVAAHESCC